MFPFIVIRSRNNAAVRLPGILKGGLCRCGLTSGINKWFVAPRQVKSPLHRKNSSGPSAVWSDHGDYVGRSYLSIGLNGLCSFMNKTVSKL